MLASHNLENAWRPRRFRESRLPSVAGSDSWFKTRDPLHSRCAASSAWLSFREPGKAR